MGARRAALAVLACGLGALAASCAGVQRWPDEGIHVRAGSTIDESWRGKDPGVPDAVALAEAAGSASATIDLVSEDNLFRNTYYDFPKDGAGEKDATVYDAACAPIAKVTRAFHDQVCVQGSGRLSMGQTVSFAKRDCACADVCPRTGQKICFERLDPARFPYGRGATGGPITPLVTVAVDVTVIPLGTPIFVPELVGLPRVDGSPHDGCFVAQDRGLKVVGKHIDIFTGDPSMTLSWNARVPSNRGVHVRVGDPRCSRR
jgi:3D (Asp-Asp-Asp) domain-containing protein